MTVGPETMRIAPSMIATGQGIPMMKCAARLASTPVIGAPMKTSRRTTVRSLPCNLILVRPTPPWKRMIATTKSTAMEKIGPSTVAGVSPGATIPRMNPAGRSRTSAGIRSLGAMTWQAVAMPKTRTTARMICWLVGSDTTPL